MPVVVRAKAIITCDTEAPQNGITFEQLGSIENGAIVIGDNGVIVSCHREESNDRERSRQAESNGEHEVLEFPDCIIVPGFVDAHTHPMFAGTRERGQDMLHTIAETRAALQYLDAFWKIVEPRLKLMLAHGTTTAEVKTGYAQTATGELRLLDLVRDHLDDPDLPRIVPTLLGLHTVPPEFKTADPYIDNLIAECLPNAKARGAIYADAFCEPGYFAPSQTRRYFEAARYHGLRLRAHCNEMEHSAAVAMAAQAGVDAFDHCNVLDEHDIETIASSDGTVVACPSTIAYLGLKTHAPVRQLLEAGATVALASDYNPGTSPCFNLQTVAHYGRKIFDMSAAEALYGVTRAAAKSMRLDAGYICAGAPADFVVLELSSPDEFGWQFGANFAKTVFRNGRRTPG